MWKSKRKKLEERLKSLEDYLGVISFERWGEVEHQTYAEFGTSRMTVIDKILEERREEERKRDKR